MSDLIERLQDRLTLKFVADCKCGSCQCVPAADIAEAVAELQAWERAAESTDIVEYLHDALKRMGTVGPRGIREMVAHHIRLQASLSSKDAEIEALRTRAESAEALLAEAGKALEPFAEFAHRNTDEDGWSGTRCEGERIRDWFGPSEFRLARSTLSKIGDRT